MTAGSVGAVPLVVLFSATSCPMLHLYNAYRFLIINSSFNLSLRLLRLN